MAQGKQAKILTRSQERVILQYLRSTRNPERDRCMFLLSIKAGLRVKEIAALQWRMVTDGTGQVAECIALPGHVSKGKSGRTVFLHPDLKKALEKLQTVSPNTQATWPVIYSTQNKGLSPASAREWFLRLYRTLGMEGCSSHSGRRTFITRAARKISEADGSLRDVQQLAGHAGLNMSQRYSEGDTDAKRKIVGTV